MRVYYDSDADINLIKGKKVAVVGYGSQGHAHVLNLRDSGVKDVVVALRVGSATAKKAEGEGVKVMSVADAAKWADVLMMLTPGRNSGRNLQGRHRRQYQSRRRAAVRAWPQRAFRPDRAPQGHRRADGRAKGSRPHRARRISQGRGRALPDRHSQDASGNAHDIGLSYASAIGGGRSGIIETTFKEECETDLFGEQAVLCGGLVELIRAGFETLVEAGYAPEMAYFECLHEVKLIVDLIYEGGIANMNYSISNTAEYGEYVTGPRIITARDQGGDEGSPRRTSSPASSRPNGCRRYKAGQPASRASAASTPRTRSRKSAPAARHDALDRQEQAGRQG